MGTAAWPDRRHKTKRERKFRAHDIPIVMAESRWQCQTCPGVIASDEDIYCVHCKIYWQDVSNGIFED